VSERGEAVENRRVFWFGEKKEKGGGGGGRRDGCLFWGVCRRGRTREGEDLPAEAGKDGDGVDPFGFGGTQRRRKGKGGPPPLIGWFKRDQSVYNVPARRPGKKRRGRRGFLVG